MNTWRVAAATLTLSLLLVACRRNTPEITPLSGPPQVGSLYSQNDGEGGFRVAKIISADAEVIFVNLYGDRWTTRPTPDTAQKADRAAPIAFSVGTFAGMQPVALKTGSVSADELEAYEAWKKSDQDPL
jgi:hypothetical protein